MLTSAQGAGLRERVASAQEDMRPLLRISRTRTGGGARYLVRQWPANRRARSSTEATSAVEGAVSLQFTIGHLRIQSSRAECRGSVPLTGLTINLPNPVVCAANWSQTVSTYIYKIAWRLQNHQSNQHPVTVSEQANQRIHAWWQKLSGWKLGVYTLQSSVIWRLGAAHT